jgi:thiamine-phosphate pyrophosphorylase
MYVTDPATSPLPILEVARAAVEGGADCVQVRGARTDRELFDLARAVVDAVGDRARVLVNERLDVAIAAGAAGVHLKDRGLAPDEVLAAAGRLGAAPGFVAGLSAHDADGLRRAARSGALHASLSPLHEAHGSPGLGAGGIAAVLAEAGELPSAVLLLGGAGPGDAALARERSTPRCLVGLAAIRFFQQGSALEIARRTERLARALGMA